MEFKIENREILPILAAVGKVINSKNPMPIARDFLFRCNDGVVSVTATDGETTIEKSLPVLTVEGNDSFCIDSKWLLNLLRKMGTKVVTIASSAEKITVTHNSGSYDFPANNPEEFPKTASVDSGSRVSFDVSDLADGINHTITAASEETIRPIMCGILIDLAPDCVTFVASDTHILSRFRNKKYHLSLKENVGAVLPSKAARILVSVLPSEGSVSLVLSEKGMMFQGEGFTLSCPVCKGKYPNYNRVIPSQDGSTEILIDREELKSSLQRLDICTDTQYSTVIMSVDMAGVILSGRNDNFGIAAKETITADVTGANRRVAYTSGYLTNWLDMAGTRLVAINIIDESRPLILRPSEDKKDTEWISIVMPLTLVE